MKRDPSFKKLQELWYQKLKESHFVDIEDTNGEDPLLKNWDNNFFRNKFNKITYEATIKYYDNARKLLRTYKFKTEQHCEIWRLHCEGYSERKIARQVQISYRKSMVHYVIASIARNIVNE